MTTPLGSIEIGPREGRRVTVARTTARDRHHGHARPRRRGPRGDRHGHRVLRPPARLARPPRPVRSRDPAPTATSRSTSTTRSRTSRSSSGRRSPRRSATGPGSPGSAQSSVPMDESLATAVVDVGGRPYAVIDLPFRGERVGGLPLQLVEHALESFARTAGATLHLSRHRAQRPPPRRGRLQGARPRAPRGLRDRPAARRAWPRPRASSDERVSAADRASSTTARATW